MTREISSPLERVCFRSRSTSRATNQRGKNEHCSANNAGWKLSAARLVD